MIATGERLQGLYAYNIPFDNKARIEKYGQIIKTMIAFTAKVGHCRFPSKYGGGAGHVEIVESANLNTFTSFAKIGMVKVGQMALRNLVGVPKPLQDMFIITMTQCILLD